MVALLKFRDVPGSNSSSNDGFPSQFFQVNARTLVNIVSRHYSTSRMRSPQNGIRSNRQLSDKIITLYFKLGPDRDRFCAYPFQSPCHSPVYMTATAILSEEVRLRRQGNASDVPCTRPSPVSYCTHSTHSQRRKPLINYFILTTKAAGSYETSVSMYQNTRLIPQYRNLRTELSDPQRSCYMPYPSQS